MIKSLTMVIDLIYRCPFLPGSFLEETKNHGIVTKYKGRSRHRVNFRIVVIAQHLFDRYVCLLVVNVCVCVCVFCSCNFTQRRDRNGRELHKLIAPQICVVDADVVGMAISSFVTAREDVTNADKFGRTLLCLCIKASVIGNACTSQ
jgi:hypothetical protein